MTTRNSPVRLRLLPAALCLGAAFAVAPPAAGQTVWTGLTKTFSKAIFSDHNLPENQDPLTANVVLTRGSTGGMINIAAEQFFNQAVSPQLTQWATDLNNPSETIAATNWQNLAFTNWLDAYGGAGSMGNFIAGRDAVVHLTSDDVYLDLRFTSWDSFSGGGHSYLRAEPPATSPTGDHNGDGIVDAADYVVWRKTGINGQQGYDDWRANFGNIISGSASGTGALAVPEPASVVLFLTGLIALRWLSRTCPAGRPSCPR